MPKNNKKTEKHNSFAIPLLISDGIAFSKIIQSRKYKFRDALYEKLDMNFGTRAASHKTYKTWLAAPERLPKYQSSEFYEFIHDAIIATITEQATELEKEGESLIKEGNELLDQSYELLNFIKIRSEKSKSEMQH